MTTPAQPETPATGPGTPATGEQTPEPTTPVTDVQPPATGDDGTDWKKHARTWETKSKANEAALKERDTQLAAMRKALNLETDEDLPEHAKRKLAEYEQKIEEYENKNLEYAYKDAVRSAAPKVGADDEVLLDSDSFRAAVGEELGDDFDDDDMRKAVAKVAKEFAKKPRFAKSQGSPRSGADFTGAPGAPPNIDQAIADAQSKGDFKTAIALKRRRTAG